MLYFISLGLLIFSGFADFFTGRLCKKYNATETNSAGEYVGSFGSVFIVGMITSVMYFTTTAEKLLSIPNFGFFGYHLWAAIHNYLLYKSLKSLKG
jgi:hypothetical protein